MGGAAAPPAVADDTRYGVSPVEVARDVRYGAPRHAVLTPHPEAASRTSGGARRAAGPALRAPRASRDRSDREPAADRVRRRRRAPGLSVRRGELRLDADADAAVARDRRDPRRGAASAPGRAAAGDGDRLPRGRRRRDDPRPVGPPGQRGARAAADPRRLRRQRQRARVVPPRRERHLGARRGRAAGHGRVRAGGRDRGRGSRRTSSAAGASARGSTSSRRTRPPSSSRSRSSRPTPR